MDAVLLRGMIEGDTFYIVVAVAEIIPVDSNPV